MDKQIKKDTKKRKQTVQKKVHKKKQFWCKIKTEYENKNCLL
jgi:hypothetical protein